MERSEIQFGTTHIPFLIRRSDRRATVALAIDGGKLVVTAPAGARPRRPPLGAPPCVRSDERRLGARRDRGGGAQPAASTHATAAPPGGGAAWWPPVAAARGHVLDAPGRGGRWSRQRRVSRWRMSALVLAPGAMQGAAVAQRPARLAVAQRCRHHQPDHPPVGPCVRRRDDRIRRPRPRPPPQPHPAHPGRQLPPQAEEASWAPRLTKTNHWTAGWGRFW